MSESNAFEWVCATRMKRSQTKGVALLAAKWTPGQELRIGFLAGSKKLRQRVFKVAERWTRDGPGGANLVFKHTDDVASADIRIAFDPAGGSWSMLGNEAQSVANGSATMNLGWATEDAPDSEFDSVVLHEFGHAIALLHEHNHPNLDLHWKKEVVYADLGGDPNYWSKDDVDYNVFEQYPLNRVEMTNKPNMVSIMIYTIPARWLDGQPAIMPSNHLSPGDITFIRSLYP